MITFHESVSLCKGVPLIFPNSSFFDLAIFVDKRENFELLVEKIQNILIF